MANRTRTEADLSIHDGPYRSFEWFWDANGSMPGLDAYDSLPASSQDDFLASVRHWGNVEPGSRPAQSRVNQEHADPLVVAIKAGKHRFTAFREESGPTWIVCKHYLKESQQRDKAGDRVVKQTIKSREFYLSTVKDGTYYERN
ncbi:MAG: hypothetical protein JO036_15280 [Candidatus Eremiobacteraeota bacterium]|nr:hypothetical protein [Candidatus Eremiobacteraeota bacterium]